MQIDHVLNRAHLSFVSFAWLAAAGLFERQQEAGPETLFHCPCCGQDVDFRAYLFGMINDLAGSAQCMQTVGVLALSFLLFVFCWADGKWC